MRRVTFVLTFVLAVMTAGCNVLAWPLYVLAPNPPRKTVRAEYDGLVGQTVAVVIYADMDMQYEYPYCRDELGMAVGKELVDNVKGVWVVPPSKVSRYQDGNVYWDTMSMVEVGRALKADRVLYISLSEYSTHERGSITLPQGRVSGAISVWDCHAPLDSSEACVWRKADLSVKIDATAGPLGRNPAALRVLMQKDFAGKLGRYFYDHKEPRVR